VAFFCAPTFLGCSPLLEDATPDVRNDQKGAPASGAAPKLVRARLNKQVTWAQFYIQMEQL